NERRKGKVTEMFNRYVKAPIISEGIRLDTVVVATNGDIIYNYTQSIQTRPELRKVDITLAGDIFEQEKQVYKVPTSEPLTFYISSLSAFVDPTVKYMTRIVERKVEANTACYIDFEQGSDIIDDQLGHNLEEISRIKKNIASLIENIEFEMDSIVVTASASPEGSWAFNTNLSKKRSSAVSAYFEKYIKHYTDSLDREKGFFIDFDSGAVSRESLSEVPFISRYNPENWTMLDVLVAQDETISEDEKFIYNLRKEIEDPDIREVEMQSLSGYLYMRENLYPRLRTVKFDFHLHRKGMVKDTIHTTVIDSAYMAGVEAVVNHDYQKGVTLLRPYNDYNSAVAFCAMGYDESALQILTNLDKNAQVNYMLAIIYSRRNDEENAVQHYLRSCRDNPTYLHRGMLDPEISLLIKKYGLNNLIN
ncbi:MAG: hypothetical protein HUJ90_03785, partial [Bacteroidales bacterium]|nr:hypothetical protein [Bacteroidales bacterium]